MKILITGGSGFIGTNFVKCALNRNHIIYNIDNLSLFSKDQNISHKNYIFSKIDIRNESLKFPNDLSYLNIVPYFWNILLVPHLQLRLNY